ncbi:MAG: hypothetical protein AB2A00_33000 [Myxococcota bacterium]
MSIQGGGKVPPGSAGRTHGADRPRRAAEKRQAREAGEAQEAKAPKRATNKDVFETSTRAPIATPGTGTALPPGMMNTLPPGTRLEDLVGTPSQIKQMAEAISAHAKRLSGEFDGLRTDAQQVVNKLAAQGFSADAVADSRAELGALRKQMAHLRGKIAADGRRLKLLKAAAHKLGDAKLSEKLSGQLKKISDMERGWGRAFLALGIAGTLTAQSDEARAATRVNLGAGAQQGVDRHALGTYLAQLAPGTAASQLLVSLLEEGPLAPNSRLIAEAYAELHADVLAGRFGKSLQSLGVWRQAMG